MLRLKFLTARRVFVASLKLRFASCVVIPRYPEEGLAANLLHVLEVVHRLRPDASVHVDWVLTGTEKGFRYGEVGADIWAQLFQSLGPRPEGAAHQATSRIDLAFWGTGKDHVTGKFLQRHRQVYHSTGLKWLEITNEHVLEQVREIRARFMDGRFCIGIHRRVGNALVANLQGDGRVASLELFAETVEWVLSTLAQAEIPDHMIFLATDDAEAVDTLTCIFGSRLVVRDNVKRTTPDAPEVHFRDWGDLSISDAEDVLIDTILLANCNVLVHASSSVSTVASIMNPALTLVRI